MDIHSQFTTQDLSSKDPEAILSMFFSLEQLAIIAKHTNEYAKYHKSKKWRILTVDELRDFITLSTFMGIYIFPAERDYWKKEFVLPVIKNMALNRFLEIKRYLHISALLKQEEVELLWWKKLEPLASFVRQTSQQLLVQAT